MTIQDRADEMINGVNQRLEKEFGNEDFELKERINFFVNDELYRLIQEIQFYVIEQRY